MRELHRPFNEFLASQLQPVDESDKSWIDYHVESVSERSQMRIGCETYCYVADVSISTALPAGH